MSSHHKEWSERPRVVLSSMIAWAMIGFGGCAAEDAPRPLATHAERESAGSGAGHAGASAGDIPAARVISDPSAANADDPNPPGDPEPGDGDLGDEAPAAPSDGDPGAEMPTAPSDGDPMPPSDDGSDQPMSDRPAVPMDGDGQGPVMRFPAAPMDISATADVSAGATFEVREETYSLPDVRFDYPTGGSPDDPGIVAEMLGVVVAPVNAPGPRPLAVFIHGQHASCYNLSDGKGLEGAVWPCPEGTQPVPSYRGYLSYQRFLASQGWVTVSVSANGVGGNGAVQFGKYDITIRSQLVEAHLRQWDAWIKGGSAVQAPKILETVQPDLQRLLLVGHSRGGATANQVALKSVTDPASPWRARAQVLIGPTIENFNPTPAVPVVVLLPGCDGDVTDLRGQGYIDRAVGITADTALRTSVFIAGANHDFFNAEWDPSTAVAKGAAKDDAAELFAPPPVDDTLGDGNSGNGTPAARILTADMLPGACRPGAAERLGGEQQRDVGSFFIAVAAKVFVEGDDTFLPLIDGSLACSGASCDPHVLTHALGGRRQPVLIPSASSVPAGSPIATCLTARDTGADACITANMPRFKERPRTPHFGAAIDGPVTQAPSQIALRMEWSAPGAPASIVLNRPVLDQDVSQLEVRVIAAPDAVDTTFALSLIDGSGQELSLGAVAMGGVPANAGNGAGVYWAQNVRLPLDRSGTFDFSAIAQLRITPQSASGVIWVLDAWGYKPGLAPLVGTPARFELLTQGSSVDANGATLVTGNVFGDLREDAEIYYFVPVEEGASIEGRYQIAAGTRSFTLPLPVPPGVSGWLSPQLLGVKGIVAAARSASVTIPNVAAP